MQYEVDDDKARALRSQLDLCRRMAEEVGDPDIAGKLRNLAEKLKEQATNHDRPRLAEVEIERSSAVDSSSTQANRHEEPRAQIPMLPQARESLP